MNFLGHGIAITIFAGTCFFMLGMSLASDNLQKLAATRIRDLISKISTKPLVGVLTGVIVTFLVQSSGAMTSMLVGLGTAGVISLPQVMGIILGTGVGTTLTVQLLSLKIAQWGLWFFAGSFTCYFMARRTVTKRISGAVMGFGLMFWGLEMMGAGAEALKQVEFVVEGLTYFKENPFIMLVGAALITGLVHSSAVVIGLAMSLASSGLIDLVDAFYWVYGANIGTTATALMASLGGNHVGRQVAWAHCFHKTAVVVIFYFLTPYAAEFVGSGNAFRDVANAHLFFNVAGAIMFFPFIKKGAQWVEKLFPPSPADKEFSVKYLDRGSYDSPAVGLAHAEREVLRMADIVQTMVKDSKKLLVDHNEDLVESIEVRDNKVDLLNREISLFLSRLMERNPGMGQEQMIRLINFASDLESAADVIENSLLELSNKMHNLKLNFSNEGKKEIEALHKKVVEMSQLSISCFQMNSKDLAAKVLYQKREVRKMERECRASHIERLSKGMKESINTSSIHMDTIGDFRRISGLMSNHVYSRLRDSDQYNILPRRE